MKRYTKREREDAALILAVVASGVDENYAVSIETAAGLLDMVEWGPVVYLARMAWGVAYGGVAYGNYWLAAQAHGELEADTYGIGRRIVYAEAEALIRTGWSPA